jgi:hypothetical protein
MDCRRFQNAHVKEYFILIPVEGKIFSSKRIGLRFWYRPIEIRIANDLIDG